MQSGDAPSSGMNEHFIGDDSVDPPGCTPCAPTSQASPLGRRAVYLTTSAFSTRSDSLLLNDVMPPDEAGPDNDKVGPGRLSVFVALILVAADSAAACAARRKIPRTAHRDHSFSHSDLTADAPLASTPPGSASIRQVSDCPGNPSRSGERSDRCPWPARCSHR